MNIIEELAFNKWVVGYPSFRKISYNPELYTMLYFESTSSLPIIYIKYMVGSRFDLLKFLGI